MLYIYMIICVIYGNMKNRGCSAKQELIIMMAKTRQNLSKLPANVLKIPRLSCFTLPPQLKSGNQRNQTSLHFVRKSPKPLTSSQHVNPKSKWEFASVIKTTNTPCCSQSSGSCKPGSCWYAMQIDGFLRDCFRIISGTRNEVKSQTRTETRWSSLDQNHPKSLGSED